MGIEEQELREWVQRVAHREASRRQFMHTLVGLGLSGPLIADVLTSSPPAAAQGTPGGNPPLPRPGAGVGASCACCRGAPRRC
jgi:hypothetical protein